MLQLFIKNRHGVISIMLAVVLIASLSMSSTLLEAARYRSLERLYKTIEENAAFSILSQYDRDLYENFGLLAIQQDIGKEEFIAYLEQNLLGMGSGMDQNNADALSSGLTEADLEKLYDLTQNEVFRAQIAEFSAYRAPASIINNTLDLEESLNEMMEKLDDALPMLETFSAALTSTNTLFDATIAAQKYAFSCADMVENLAEYSSAVDNFNSSVSEMNSYRDEHDSSEEGYADGLEEMAGVVAESAAEVREKIADLQDSLKDLNDKQEDFAEKCKSMMQANIGATLSAAKADLGSVEDEDMREGYTLLFDALEKGYVEGEDSLVEAYHTLEEKFSNFTVQSVIDELQAQADELSGNPKSLTQIVNMTGKVFAKNSPLNTIVYVVLELGENVLSLMTGLIETIKQIVECARVLSTVLTTGGVVDPSMNHTITAPYSGGKLKETQNPYAASDGEIVDRQLEATREVAESVGYDPALMETDTSPEEVELWNAIDNLKNAALEFNEACQILQNPIEKKIDVVDGRLEIEFHLNFLPAEYLEAMKSLLTSLITLFKSMIETVKAFIDTITHSLQKMLFQRIYGAVYATEMFSNRITDTGGETRLNGSAFFSSSDYADPGRCFVRADAEYIFTGGQSEINNQTIVFLTMMMIRMMCNIPTILTDKEFINTLTELTGIPIIGWVVAVILVVVKIMSEAWADMIFMIYGREKVDIIKVHGYFEWSGNGIKELEQRMAALAENQGISLQLPDGTKDDSGGKTGDSGGTNSSGSSGSSGSTSSSGSSGNSGGTSSSGSSGNSGGTSSSGSSGNSGGTSSSGSSGNSGGTSSSGSSGDSAAKDSAAGSGGSGSKVPGVLQNYLSELLQWGYKDHLLLMTLIVPSDWVYLRCANLIELEIGQKKAKDGVATPFKLEEMATYIRTEVDAEYTPLLPVPSIPGLNKEGFSIKTMHYSGY